MKALMVVAIVVGVSLSPTVAFANPPAGTPGDFYEEDVTVLIDPDTCTFQRTWGNWYRNPITDDETGEFVKWGPWKIDGGELFTETWQGTINDPSYVLEPGETETPADCPWLSADPDPADLNSTDPEPDVPLNPEETDPETGLVIAKVTAVITAISGVKVGL